MKKVLTFIIALLSFTKIFACDCGTSRITDNFMHSDFVALITIEKNYLNEGDNEFYKADISIEELFKGKQIQTINIYGRSDGKMGNSCAIFLPEGTKLIAYSSEYNETFGIGQCSGLAYLKTPKESKWQIHENVLKKTKKELKLLRKLKENNVSFTNKYKIKPHFNLSPKLREIKNVDTDNEFGVYKIVFNSDFSIGSINTLFGFDSKIDKEIISILENLDWKEVNKRKKIEIPDDTEYIIAIKFIKYKGVNGGQFSYYF